MLNAKALKHAKDSGHKIAMVTAYDYPFARLAASAGVDMILVGDSAANVVLGMESTREIGMTEMEIFVAAVHRGAPQTHIVGDMPYGSEVNASDAVVNAKRLMAAGAHSVKIEGPKYEIIQYLIQHDIPVVGHLGLLPQTATSFKKVAQTEAEQIQLLCEAQKLSDLGICALVLEHIPADLGQRISRSLTIPVIGIGAGPYCDGQVMVLHDLLGISAKIPSLAHPFAHLNTQISKAFQDYVAWVQESSDLKSLKSTETKLASSVYGS